jgi:hypothetical protein
MRLWGPPHRCRRRRGAVGRRGTYKNKTKQKNINKIITFFLNTHTNKQTTNKIKIMLMLYYLKPTNLLIIL